MNRPPIHLVDRRQRLIRPAEPLCHGVKRMLSLQPALTRAPQVHDAAIALMYWPVRLKLLSNRFPMMKAVALPMQIGIILERGREPAISPNPGGVIGMQRAAEIVTR